MSYKYPPDSDLRRLLRFEPNSGAIWLGERRMLLTHTLGLTALRRDLVSSVGIIQVNFDPPRRSLQSIHYRLSNCRFQRLTDTAREFLQFPTHGSHHDHN